MTGPSKTVKRTLRKDITYQIEDKEWTLRADFPPILADDGQIETPGVLSYLIPNEQGAYSPPNETNCEQYVFAAVPEGQRAAFVEAVMDGSFPSYLLLDAATTAWKNTKGISAIDDYNERAMHLAAERLKQLESAESQAEFLAALKGETDHPETEDDSVDPSGD